MLSELMIYLQAPSAATKTMALLAQAPSQQEQLDYAKSLRMLRVGWTMDQRRQYMEWFLKAMNYRGGASFGLFIEHIKTEAVAALPDDARKALKPIIDAKPEKISPQQTYAKMLEGRTVVKQWTVDELAPVVEKGLKGGRDFDHGKRLFGAVGCFACHRFDNDGGAIGPDLTGVGGRFSPRDLLESIVEPSKVISDQYQQTVITTTTGDVIVGRIANLKEDTYQVMTNMYEPDHLTGVNARVVKSIKPSKLSPMPEGLLNVLHESEIEDLMAYLLSGGDKSNKMFASATR